MVSHVEARIKFYDGFNTLLKALEEAEAENSKLRAEVDTLRGLLAYREEALDAARIAMGQKPYVSARETAHV